MPRLDAILDALAETYGEPEPPPERSLLDLVVLENVAYLVDDAKRQHAFEALRKRVGTSPGQLLAASDAALYEITGAGILAENQVDKLRRIAHLARDVDSERLGSRPLAQAKRGLMKFPSIGEPGAEKILLFGRTHTVLGLDSNGVRVLTRLGLVQEEKSYAQTYRGVQAWAAEYVERGSAWLIRAHQLLRQHGQELCRRSRPRCALCPLTDRCRYYAGAIG
jgi:endonuclease III